MRKKIFDIIEPAQKSNTFSSIYDSFMIVIILLSLLPLCFKETSDVLTIIDTVCLLVFIVDYLLRWIKNSNNGFFNIWNCYCCFASRHYYSGIYE